MADQPQECTGADDPRERCGRHHPLAILDGRTCCCDAPWLLTKNTCFSGAAEGDPVTIEAKLQAMLGYTVADTPQDVRAHVEGVMGILARHAEPDVEDVATDLYKAQDALAFVAECCDVADRKGAPTVTTADVRRWLEGAKCGRQLLAEEGTDGA